METSIKKWGNSLGIRIPANITKQLGLSNGSKVNLQTVNDKLEITRSRDLSLDKLVSQIDGNNRHQEIETTESKGNEAW